jgi:hypothetical protein
VEQHLTERLAQSGFYGRSKHLMTILQSSKCHVLYTDHSILLACLDSKELESIIEELKKAELDLTMEGARQHYRLLGSQD